MFAEEVREQTREEGKEYQQIASYAADVSIVYDLRNSTRVCDMVEFIFCFGEEAPFFQVRRTKEGHSLATTLPSTRFAGMAP